MKQKLPLAKYLSHGIWAIVTHENLQLTLSCRSSSKQSSSIDIHPTFGILTVNNDCLASNKYMTLPGHFDKNSYFEMSDVLRSLLKVSNGAKIRNRYNQVPHLTQDTNGKVTNSQKTPQTRAKRSALSQQMTTKHI